PSGALNALITALSERYVDVAHLGRVHAAPGFMVVGSANPLDDIGTGRLSRGLMDRFLVLEVDYQPRDEDIEIVLREAPAAGRTAPTRVAATLAAAPTGTSCPGWNGPAAAGRPANPARCRWCPVTCRWLLARLCGNCAGWPTTRWRTSVRPSARRLNWCCGCGAPLALRQTAWVAGLFCDR